MTIAQPATLTEDFFMSVLSGPDVWLIDSNDIVKIASPEKITKVPGAPPRLSGVVSLSGVIYSLIDFNKLNAHGPVIRNNKARIIFLDQKTNDDTGDVSEPVALLVDRVFNLMPLPGIVKQDSSNKSRYIKSIRILDAVAFYVADIDKICLDAGLVS